MLQLSGSFHTNACVNKIEKEGGSERNREGEREVSEETHLNNLKMDSENHQTKRKATCQNFVLSFALFVNYATKRKQGRGGGG